MKQNRSLIVGVILTAAAGFVAIQGWIEPKPETGTLSPTSTFTLTPTASYEGCAYVWVYHDAADLTAKLNAQIAALDPKASANASLYGEDCVYSDGHSTFGAMETDFYIHLPAEGPINEEAFGNWMARVLPIILQIPREAIQGNYGFAEFWFEAAATDHVIVRVPIQSYIADANRQTGAELFRKYHSTP